MIVSKDSKFQMDTFDSFWEMDSDKKLNRKLNIKINQKLNRPRRWRWRRFPSQIKVTQRYSWNIVECGVKHHNPNPKSLRSLTSRWKFFIFSSTFRRKKVELLSSLRRQRQRLTFNNISAISLRHFYLWRKPEYWRKSLICASHWQTLSPNVVSSTPHLSKIRTHNFSGDRHWLHS
jgi:hypothetical protein